jgi:hypothetical protein
MNSTRRQWFSTCLAMAAWPDVLSALQHAGMAAGSPTPHFEALDESTAEEIEAFAAPPFGYYDAQMNGEKH